MKKLLDKADEKLNKLLLKTYFNRWKNISKGIYNAEDKSITLIQSTFRAYIKKKKIKLLLKRNKFLEKFIFIYIKIR